MRAVDLYYRVIKALVRPLASVAGLLRPSTVRVVGREFLAAESSTCAMIGGQLFYVKALFAFIAFVFE